MSATSQMATFYQEVDELLAVVEAAALGLERAPADGDLINQLFRALHTIKGSSGVVGLDALARFTHHLESALERVRAGTLVVTPALINTVLVAKDHITALVSAAKDGRTLPAGLDAPILERLNRLGVAIAAPSAAVGPISGVRTSYEIFFRPHFELFRNGIEPMEILENLRELGPCEIRSLVDRLSPPSTPVPDACEFAWQISLTTQADEAAVRDVFMFVENDCELRIDRGMSEFMTEPPAQRVPSLLPRPRAEQSATQAAPSTVRVASERLDQLVTLVGELVINQARLQQAFGLDGNPELAGAVEAQERLISELRDGVFGIRMLPIGTTFSRFQRLVRDLAAELQKEIVLVTEGGETELDKTVLDQLGEPLVHLIRNSIDHGIELPADRVAAGKPRHGTVLLRAIHDGNSVVITIQDDGRGLDRTMIRAKAEEKGLIAPGTALSEQEAFELIMLPGFSTATAVTQVSGRGVGMDVVKKTVEGLRGRLYSTSEPGRGTTIRLTLPITVAIIDGLLVEVQGDRFIVPMASVTENVELYRADRTANNGRNAVPVRGELVPYVRLRELFSIEGAEQDVEKVVIVELDGQRVGLVVDRVVGSHQTVIQPLSRILSAPLFSGTTIIGDGRVAMILDLLGTVRQASEQAHAARSS